MARRMTNKRCWWYWLREAGGTAFAKLVSPAWNAGATRIEGGGTGSDCIQSYYGTPFVFRCVLCRILRNFFLLQFCCSVEGCSATYKIKKSLLAHMRTAHHMFFRSDNKDMAFTWKCRYCFRVLSDARGLLRHEESCRGKIFFAEFFLWLLLKYYALHSFFYKNTL